MDLIGGVSLEDQKMLAEIRFKESEALFKESEAHKNLAEAGQRESQVNMDKIKVLSSLLLDKNPGMFFDSYSTAGTTVFEEEDQRDIIREKILSIVKKL